VSSKVFIRRTGARLKSDIFKSTFVISPLLLLLLLLLMLLLLFEIESESTNMAEL